MLYKAFVSDRFIFFCTSRTDFYFLYFYITIKTNLASGVSNFVYLYAMRFDVIKYELGAIPMELYVKGVNGTVNISIVRTATDLFLLVLGVVLVHPLD